MDEEAELAKLRRLANAALKAGKLEEAGAAIAKAVPLVLKHEVIEPQQHIPSCPGPTAAPKAASAPADGPGASSGATPAPGASGTSGSTPFGAEGSKVIGQSAAGNGQPAGDASSSSSDDSSGGEDGSDSDSSSESGGEEEAVPPITSYRYRSQLRLPRNSRLEHLCQWLYESVVHPETGEEPEEVSCQKLPAAIMAAWRVLLQQQQQSQLRSAASVAAVVHEAVLAAAQAPHPHQPSTTSTTSVPTTAADAASAPTLTAATPAADPAVVAAAAAALAVPPTEVLHLQHAPFHAPFHTWRPAAPDALPPMHDVLVGVMRVCWERHDDAEPSRNVIWGAQTHSGHGEPVTAYMYVEYVRLQAEAIIRGGTEPLWLWHELQEIIEEYKHWRHHPHEVAVLARMMVEYGCGRRLLESLLDHIGRAPLLMYGAWAALWDGLDRPLARTCVRLAGQHGVAPEAVWVHVAELTLLQVKEHPRAPKLLARAVAVLQRVMAITPAPQEMQALLVAERDALSACEGVREVMSQLDLPPPASATPAIAVTVEGLEATAVAVVQSVALGESGEAGGEAVASGAMQQG